jgi:hypothetical protein
MDGYARLAALIGDLPEFAIFRRFMSLRALHLLYLSAEIAHLSADLNIQADLDRTSGDSEKIDFDFHYETLLKSRTDIQKSRQIELWDRLAAKLKEQGIIDRGPVCFNGLCRNADLPSQARPYLRIGLCRHFHLRILNISRTCVAG